MPCSSLTARETCCCRTIEDFNLNLTTVGIAVAIVSLTSTALQQVLVRKLQKQYNISPTELLSLAAPVCASALLLVGPFIDKNIDGQWITSYNWDTEPVAMILLSCFLAVLVNMSQFICLGRLATVSFQVSGHLKTVFVFLLSWAFVGEEMPKSKLFGILLTLTGIICYGMQFGGKPVEVEADKPITTVRK